MKSGREAGFTLTEIIVAMFILTMVAMGLNAAMVSLIHGNATAKHVSEATALGNQKLEQLRIKPYAMIQGGGEDVGKEYYRQCVVNTDGNKKSVVVTVSWPRTTQRHGITLSTLIAQQ